MSQPDWTADWLHREAVATLDLWAARESGVDHYEALLPEQQAAYRQRLESAIRKNSFDAASGTITLDADRAEAIANVAAHYNSLFANEPDTAVLREAYAMKNNAVPDPEHRRALAAFYWWTGWAATTERPGKDITYTNSWLAEDLVGNRPPASADVLPYALTRTWHLWVEGFFEVFATAVIAFLFTRLGLLKVSTATVAVLFATIVFMAGGVLGTLHHLYFTGTPTAVLALGASFSALEVVPLAYIGFEAYHTYKLGHATPWMARYRWPILFFTAVAFRYQR